MKRKTPAEKMVRVVIYLPPKMSDALDAVANRAGISRSELVRHDVFTGQLNRDALAKPVAA